MVAVAGSPPALRASPGGSLTGWGSALALLPSAALPPALGGAGAMARGVPSSEMRVWRVAKATGRLAWFLDRLARVGF